MLILFLFFVAFLILLNGSELLHNSVFGVIFFEFFFSFHILVFNLSIAKGKEKIDS